MKAAVFGVLGMLFAYILCAFANAGFDISLWSSDARVFCAIGMAAMAWVGALVGVIFPVR